MFCQNCGKEVNENAVVCLGCGAATGKKKVNNNLEKDTLRRNILNLISVSFFVCGVLLLVFSAMNGVTNGRYFDHDRIYATFSLVGFGVAFVAAIINSAIDFSKKAKSSFLMTNLSFLVTSAIGVAFAIIAVATA